MSKVLNDIHVPYHVYLSLDGEYPWIESDDDERSTCCVSYAWPVCMHESWVWAGGGVQQSRHATVTAGRHLTPRMGAEHMLDHTKAGVGVAT
jgi:hypothetical protein